MLCVLAKNCTEAAYVRLVEALCQEHQIKLLKVGVAGGCGVKVGVVRVRVGMATV